MPPWADSFPNRIDVAPPVGDQTLSQIPAKRGVLLLTADADAPIVLLPAADMRARLRNRLQEPPEDTLRRNVADLRAITRRVWWVTAGSHFETDWLYYELARAIWPDRRKLADLLAWKPAWFVHVDPQADYPHFARTRDVFAEPGRYMGPFPSGKAAERFIAACQDGFYLCRSIQCLRKAPHGPRCTYAEMGKCLSPVDGSIAMDDYREEVARAARFALGEREGVLADLGEQMREAAGQLAFERAGSIKARIDRLKELDDKEFAEVRPAPGFRYVLIQASGSRKFARSYVVDVGHIVRGPNIPAEDNTKKLKVLRRFAARVIGQDRPFAPADRWRMGLVASYLWTSPQRRGVILPWRDALAAEDLAEAIDSARDELHLGGGQVEEPIETQGPDGGNLPGDGASEPPADPV